MDPELVLFYTGIAGAQDTIALMEVAVVFGWLQKYIRRTSYDRPTILHVFVAFMSFPFEKRVGLMENDNFVRV